MAHELGTFQPGNEAGPRTHPRRAVLEALLTQVGEVLGEPETVHAQRVARFARIVQIAEVAGYRCDDGPTGIHDDIAHMAIRCLHLGQPVTHAGKSSRREFAASRF